MRDAPRRRVAPALDQLRLGFDLDESGRDHVSESHRGLVDAFARVFGAPPDGARAADSIVASWVDTPLGPMLAAATSVAVCLLEFTDRHRLVTQAGILRKRFHGALVSGASPHIDQLQDELGRYFEGTLREFTVPLKAPGTPFEERVWAELIRIPYGETRSYDEMAQAVGVPRGPRAVGRANAMNRIAIVIPCHRVVNKDGRLGGYGGGLWRKENLLRLERSGHRH